MNDDDDTLSKGVAFSTALDASPFKARQLGEKLGLDSPGQTINNWKKRGVPSRYAVQVGSLLSCPPSAISNIEVADDKDSRESLKTLMLKKQLREEFLQMIEGVEDPETLEALSDYVLSGKRMLKIS